MPSFRRPSAVLLPALLASFAALSPARAGDAAPAASAADQLRFSDQETMTGELAGFAAGKGLFFRHKECEGVLTVKTGHLSALTLRARPAADTRAPAADWRITLNNGDSLAGRMAAFTPEKLTLETASGRLEIACAAIARMAYLGATEVPGAINGLGQADEWQVLPPRNPAFILRGGPNGAEPAAPPKPGKAQFKDGGLVLPTTYAVRALGLKERSRVDLELEGSPVFSLEFATEPDAAGKETSHVIYFGPGYLNVNKTRREPGMMRSEGGARFTCPKSQDGRTKVSFLSDANGTHLTIAVNGKKAGSIPLPVGAACKRLALRSDRGETRLVNLALVPGTDVLDDGADVRTDTDALVMINGDKLGGALLGIAEGKASVKTEAGTLDIPLARLRGLTFSSKHDLAQSAAGAEVARIHLAGTGHLTLKLSEIKDGRIAGTAAGLGQVALPLGAATRFEFNPAAAKADGEAAPAAQGGNPQGVEAVQALPRGGALQIIGAGGNGIRLVPQGPIDKAQLQDIEKVQQQLQQELLRQLEEAQAADAE